jgi:hypothetical protein
MVEILETHKQIEPADAIVSRILVSGNKLPRTPVQWTNGLLSSERASVCDI